MKKFRFLVILLSLLVLIILTVTPVAFAEKQTINILAGRPGDRWYVLSHALATFINERSDMLKANVVTSAGTMDNTRLLNQKEALRSNHILVSMIPGFNEWTNGEYKVYKIGTIVHHVSIFVSMDENVKKYEDFKGRTVFLGRKLPGPGPTAIMVNMLQEVGVWDQIKPMYGGFGASLDALRDGVAQIGWQGIDFIYPNSFGLSSNLQELRARAPIYFPQQGEVDKTLTLIRNALSKEPFVGKYPTLAKVIPANSLGPTQTKPLVGMATPMFWAATDKTPDEVVYEVTRILYEAAEKKEFSTYHAVGKGITPDFLVTSLWDTVEECRKNYHPGALKFYDKIGAKMKPFKQ